jgi:hypothetical protein
MKIFHAGLALLLALLAPSQASAQQVRGELLVGMSRTGYRSQRWYDDDPTQPSILEAWSDDTAGSIIRPVFGIAGAVQLLGPMWVRAEATTVTKGYAGRYSSHRVLFLEVPLLLEMTLPWAGDAGVRALAGVAPGIEVSCSAHVQLPRGAMRWIGPPIDYPVPCSRERTPNDFGGVLGLGVGSFRVGGVTFQPELRAFIGRVQRSDNYRWRHRTLSTMLRVSWPSAQQQPVLGPGERRLVHRLAPPVR